MNVDLSKNNAFGDKYFLFVNAPTARSQSLIKWDNRFKQIPILSTLSAIFILFEKLILIPAISFCNPDLVKNNHYFNYIKRQEISKCCILLVPILGDIVVYFLNRSINKLAAEKFDHKTFSAYDKIAIRDALRAIPKKDRNAVIYFVSKFYDPNKFKSCTAAEIASLMESLSKIPAYERFDYLQVSIILKDKISSNLDVIKSYAEAFKLTPANNRNSVGTEFYHFVYLAKDPTEKVKELIANRFGIIDSNEKELFNKFIYRFTDQSLDFSERNILEFIETLKEIPQSERAAFSTLLPIIDKLPTISERSYFVERLKKLSASERQNFADYTIKLIDDKMPKSELLFVTNTLFSTPAKDREALVQLALKLKGQWGANDAVDYILDAYKMAKNCKRNFIDVSFSFLEWASQPENLQNNENIIRIAINSLILVDASRRKGLADNIKENLKKVI